MYRSLGGSNFSDLSLIALNVEEYVTKEKKKNLDKQIVLACLLII
jgi:hypothetical protein